MEPATLFDQPESEPMSPRAYEDPATSEPWPIWAGPALDSNFFERETSLVARELIGCLLVSVKRGTLTGGRIVETEAYLGADDVGSHAATRGMTKRNAIMFGPAAHAYVYFTYGNHHMLNFVTEPEGIAGAVLVRAIEPLLGIDAMTSRRKGRSLGELASGPGKLTAALGVDLSDNGSRLGGGPLLVYAGARSQPMAEPDPCLRIATSGRVGLSAGWEAQLRYYLEADPWVSKGRTGPPASGARMKDEGERR